ncbi:MAG: hypothetical protein ABSF26_13280 [Thermoguttaceae bacterium]
MIDAGFIGEHLFGEGPRPDVHRPVAAGGKSMFAVVMVADPAILAHAAEARRRANHFVALAEVSHAQSDRRHDTRRLMAGRDTCLYEGMQAGLRRWPLDLALLPINGRDAKRLAANCIGNMTYQEAADLAGAIRPGLTVPTHFDMFATNCEDPQLFVDYMRIKYPRLATRVLRHGQRNIMATSQKIACDAPGKR